MRQIERTPILIVGGGIVGLATAAFLIRQGTPCMLIERSATTSTHPRARGFNPRAVELLRTLGIADQVDAVSAAFADQTLRARVESLVGPELLRADLPGSAELADLSPSRWALCGQDRLEPVIRRYAEERGADVRFGAKLMAFTPNSDGVSATVRDSQRGEYDVRADYLVAADGPRSRIRQMLDIPLDGMRGMQRQVSIVFEADLAGPLRGRRFAVCQISNEQVDGQLVHDESLRRATLYVEYRPEEGQHADDFTPSRCTELVRAAVGVPDLAVRIVDVQPWELSALTARRYRDGRVFLAGDAAHIMPSISGVGASTGVQDAHNLAWKLSLVVAGSAGPGLLDSYEAERAPIGMLTVAQCARQVISRIGVARPSPGHGLLDDLALTFAYRYHSDAVVGGAEEVLDVTDLAAQPGSRAPHLALCNGTTRLSTLDLFGAGFTLLTGADGACWAPAVARASAASGVPMRTVVLVDRQASAATDASSSVSDLAPGPVGGEPAYPVETFWCEPGGWARRYAAGPADAVLVRTDGIVAWRGTRQPGDATDDLLGVLAEVLSRPELAAAAPVGSVAAGVR